jgi:hypothetical protein
LDERLGLVNRLVRNGTTAVRRARHGATVLEMSRNDDRERGGIDPEGAFDRPKTSVIVEIAEPDVETHFELGTAYAEMGLLHDAMGEFEIVLRRDPEHPRARAALTDVRSRLLPPRWREQP